MKTGTISIGNASLHIGYSGVVKPNKRGLLREISEFFVPEEHRGKGEGTTLLEDVCSQADQKGILLMIKPDTEKLTKFYKKHGFVAIQEDSVTIMVRKPKGVRCEQ